MASLVTVVNIAGKGRTYISTQPIKAGSILLSEKPILTYPASPNFCSHCFAILKLETCCTTCASVFCSQHCYGVASLNGCHSEWLCSCLKVLKNVYAELNDGIRVQVYFLVAAYSLAISSKESFSLLLSLQGGGGAEGEDYSQEHVQDKQKEAILMHNIIKSFPGSENICGFSQELTAALLEKDRINAFGLMEPFHEGEMNVRGYGIYPRASFFNHDCLPNACRFDYIDSEDIESNREIIVRAIHDVEEGKEICLSYFPVDWCYKDRQKRLLEDYRFKCDCDRCKVEMNWSDHDNGNDNDEEMVESDEEGEVEEANDFPHAYFFLNYVCDEENCHGTLASLPPPAASNVMECNACGRFKTKEEEDGKEFIDIGDNEDGAVMVE